MIDEDDSFNKANFNMTEVLQFEIIESLELIRLLELNDIPSVDHPKYLKFNTTFDSFKNDKLKINVTFANPLIFESGIFVKDFMKTTFINPSYFNVIGEVPGRSRVANQSIELNALLPKQFDNDPASRFLVQYSDDFKSIFFGLMSL